MEHQFSPQDLLKSATMIDRRLAGEVFAEKEEQTNQDTKPRKKKADK